MQPPDSGKAIILWQKLIFCGRSQQPKMKKKILNEKKTEFIPSNEIVPKIRDFY